MNRSKDYRSQLFEKYATVVQNDADMHSEPTIRRWGEGYRYYLRNWLPENKDVAICEVACGNGRLLHLFARLNYSNVVGVDISPEQTAIARQLVPSVKVYEDDAIKWLEANPSTFDVIIGMDIIEHFYKQDVIPFLEACQLALKPGGRLILQTPNAESHWGLSERYNDFTHEVMFAQHVLSQLLYLTGFEAIASREVGPVPWGHSLKSTVRNILWQIIRLGLIIWNLAEIGTAGSKIFTRVFLITGIKKS